MLTTGGAQQMLYTLSGHVSTMPTSSWFKELLPQKLVPG